MDKQHCNVPVPRVPAYQKEPQDQEVSRQIVQNKDAVQEALVFDQANRNIFDDELRPPAEDNWLGLLCPD